ncbi:hypothetical protein V5799_012700, partial [Amblyomma americanum]
FPVVGGSENAVCSVYLCYISAAYESGYRDGAPPGGAGTATNVDGANYSLYLEAWYKALTKTAT